MVAGLSTIHFLISTAVALSWLSTHGCICKGQFLECPSRSFWKVHTAPLCSCLLRFWGRCVSRRGVSKRSRGFSMRTCPSIMPGKRTWRDTVA